MNDTKRICSFLIIFTISVLALTSLTGCSSNSAYSPLENQVYKYTCKLAKRMPRDLVITDTNDKVFYYSPSLDIKDVNDFSLSSTQNGKGTIISISKKDENLVAGYVDFDEINQKTQQELKTNLFIRLRIAIVFDNGMGYPAVAGIDMIALINGNNAILYFNEKGWKKGIVKFENFENLINMQKIDQTPVPDKEVNRYLKLAERIRKAYFKKTVPQNSKVIFFN